MSTPITTVGIIGAMDNRIAEDCAAGAVLVLSIAAVAVFGLMPAAKPG